MISDKEIKDIYPHLNRNDWRMVGMVTEEAGEVQGAWNKLQDGRPKTMEDVIEELVQLTACCYLLAFHWGISSTQLSCLAQEFLIAKRAQLEARCLTR